jgi:hypothetical protein
MKLISESIPASAIVHESRDGAVYIGGPFIDFARNRNNRVYVREDILREVARYQADAIDKKQAWGELEHPQSTNINPDRISHLITELKPEAAWVTGRAKLVDTPMGKIAQTLVMEGTIGISTRGVGEVQKDGTVKNYRLITADLVVNPSGINCFVAVVNESLEYFVDVDGKIKELKGVRESQTSANYQKALLEWFSGAFGKARL